MHARGPGQCYLQDAVHTMLKLLQCSLKQGCIVAYALRQHSISWQPAHHASHQCNKLCALSGGSAAHAAIKKSKSSNVDASWS